jgi:hypothetical protein
LQAALPRSAMTFGRLFSRLAQSETYESWRRTSSRSGFHS